MCVRTTAPVQHVGRTPGPREAATMSNARVRVTDSGGEVLQFRSPAEFFAENQNIAGFDNARFCAV